MISDMPALGILFNIDKLEEEGSYGKDAWIIFWKTIGTNGLSTIIELWEGDTREMGVFCIGIQTFDAVILQQVRSKLQQSNEFNKFAATPNFIEGTSVIKEPLVHVGRMDSNGNLTGDCLFNALDALKSLS